MTHHCTCYRSEISRSVNKKDSYSEAEVKPDTADVAMQKSYCVEANYCIILRNDQTIGSGIWTFKQPYASSHKVTSYKLL